MSGETDLAGEMLHLRGLQGLHFGLAAELMDKMAAATWSWFDSRGLEHKAHDLHSAIQLGRAQALEEAAAALRLMVPRGESGG